MRMIKNAIYIYNDNHVQKSKRLNRCYLWTCEMSEEILSACKSQPYIYEWFDGGLFPDNVLN